MDISILAEFVSSVKFEATLLVLDTSYYTVVTVAAFFMNENLSKPLCTINHFLRSIHLLRTV